MERKPAVGSWTGGAAEVRGVGAREKKNESDPCLHTYCFPVHRGFVLVELLTGYWQRTTVELRPPWAGWKPAANHLAPLTSL